VPGVADALRLREMVLHGPAGNVEARAELEPVHEAQDAVHSHPRAEAALLEIGEAPLGFLGLAEVEARLRVEVERQDDRRLLALGPRVAHGGSFQAARGPASTTSRSASPPRWRPVPVT